MKIAYAYEFDAADPMVQSGHPASILEQLQSAGTSVTPVFPLNRNAQLLFAPKVAWHRLRGRVYRPDREPRYLRSLARQVQAHVQRLRPDVVFAPGSHSVARLEVDCPIVFCADATFANVLDTYDSFSHCAPEFIAQGHAQERDALSRCAAAIFPSEWAARTAIDFYGADPARVHVVPFGANVDAPDTAAVRNGIENRDLSSLRVLFVGREWERKGADIVMAACEQLRASGHDVSVDLVGIAEPPLSLPNWVRNHGLLDKRDLIKKRILEDLFTRAHVFFVPSRAEAYGMVFCEAAAYGLPNLTSNVGGIPSIVRHGHSGYLLPPEAPVQTWAKILADMKDDPTFYRKMARASRADYEARLNWAAFGHSVVDICATVVRTAGRKAVCAASSTGPTPSAPVYRQLAPIAADRPHEPPNPKALYPESIDGRQMKIAYAYELDATDPMVQSGRPASILAQLQRQGMEVESVFPLNRNARLLFAPKAAWHRMRGRVYRPDREPRYLRSLARQIQARVRDMHPDVVFAPGSHAIARLEVDCPIVFCADATFANVLDTYDSFSHCAPEFIAQGHAQERDALSRCAAAIFPSEWAARTAIEFYGADPARVHVVPFGANVQAPDPAAVQQWIEARQLNPLRILFVGRDWVRKGADRVLETCALLHAGGLEIRLDLVGIDRPPVSLPDWATNHGLLDKRDPAQKQRLEELLRQSHFFFVPSQAENYGMAFCEAAAYGLPSLTTDSGGITTIVQHGVTGYTLAPTVPAAEWAEVLASAARDVGAYRAMANASHQDFCERLNWNAFGKKLAQILRHATS